MMNTKQRGFLTIVLAIILAVVVTGAVGYFVLKRPAPVAQEHTPTPATDRVATTTPPPAQITPAKQTSTPMPAKTAPPSSPKPKAVPYLRITSPLDGTIVHPGETLVITVEPSEGVLIGAGALGESPIGFSNEATTAPFKLSLPIPTNITPRAYHVTARGVIFPNQIIESAPLTINVEMSDLPVQLQVQPDYVSFSYVGEHFPLDVQGTFSGGTIQTLTKSSLISYSSSNPAVAVVSNTGWITTLSPGTATITVKYRSVSVDVPLSVPPTISGDLNGDGQVDQDDLNILVGALNTPAYTPYDPRDLNGDGKIDERDVEALRLLCTRPGCAIP